MEDQGAICFSCGGIGMKTKKRGMMISCTPCLGSGIIRRRRTRALKRNHITYAGFTSVGPSTVISDDEVVLGIDEELSYLSGKWRIIQSRSSHRYSTDDVVTAYIAVKELRSYRSLPCAIPTPSQPPSSSSSHTSPPRMLDIGCGLGSVVSSMLFFFLFK